MFTGYGDGFVAINQIRYEHNLIVLPDRIIEPWEVPAFLQLSAGDFDVLLPLQAEILLLGTGNRLRFPHPSLTKKLIAAKTGVEIMDTSAACRTYNILIGEGRYVAAALLVRPETSANHPV